jgi:hypothetical protein
MKQYLTLLAFLSFCVTGLAQCPNSPIDLTTQADVDNFSADFPGCTEIINGFTVQGTGIANLNGLSVLTRFSDAAVLTIQGTSITNFTGLDNVDYVGGNFQIISNQDLANFNGLEQIETIRKDLFVSGNNSILNFDGFDSLHTIGGELNARSCFALINFEGLNALNTLGINSVNNVGTRGLVAENNFSLINFDFLNGISEINGILKVVNNQSLESFEGLNNVSTIQGSMEINDNIVLPNMAGLNGLINVNQFNIASNDVLETLEGLNNLQTINGSFRIRFNPNLENIYALSGVSPDFLSSILLVEDNTSLPNCDIAIICENLFNPDLQIFISNNFTGCNTVSEIEERCILANDDVILAIETIVYPNPVSNLLHIQTSSSFTVQEVRVYSTLGEVLLFTSEETIDFTHLLTGIYFVEIVTDRGNVIKKIVKK